MKMKIKKGFSLLELILVLGVGTMVAFMKFQDMKNEQETIMAKAVGQQMKQMGEAVNRYISIRYDKLSTLASSSSQSSDPGPRICSTNGCEITYQTLVNEGLLPASYTGINAQKSTYKILLKRDGTTPNYVINGLIITTLPWSEGNRVRYDLLGQAMQEAGIDSGMTKSASVVSGFSGQWTENQTYYAGIKSTGLLAYRVGYDSALYSVYLRRDGTLPMTGNLNLGGNDINNAKNITASGAGSFGGNVTSGGNVTAAAQVIAHNGYGHALTIGGDAAGNDFDIRVGPGGKNYLGVLSYDKTPVTLAANGILLARDPVSNKNYVSLDGTTGDVNATGTVGTGSGGNVNAYMNSSGNIYAANDANVGHQINTQYVWASGNLNSNYIHSNGNIDANGRMNAGEFVYINGQANLGAGCSPNGLQGRSSDGSLLSCVNGLWSNSFSGEISSNSFNLGFSGTINLGVQKFCAIGAYRSDSEDDGQCQVYKSGANWYITTSQQSYVGCSAVCFK
ncbi:MULTISPECIES: pilus assembly protein PilV [Enterobacteriaceae]|uniref:Shufflon system plasmid conjugative transfer pilus tip adhesin PilV n=1 Tax=Raoultella planticola TaxID=575 RepID=A0ABU5MAM6_RAOPL|nr:MULTISPECIES: pilus assembly protein PilV [Enterobacteriaceae]MDW4557029.1 shufflon system plasmid conjugative transfer pilus tip adhesin PilV [Raoultella planticola]MDZ7448727.1 shufflon system plasmid conjugative transfer pilus tip adhesin PilV [Raoultella planticola]MDZ7469269.1 shufflon system plasmid conjugative transfer pilus tip adhesin PilV [Raoultella planticola]MDZ7509825.1 shufflon system plasmid conjugative transfer pilus tip adhesin PilV [Raoultella planticola]MEA5398041.1 shuf